MTNLATKSYLKVAYDLRPAKQVERRMMFDALLLLSRAGFDIGEYQYTGFGSIFFADFALFHRYLGVSRLLNVEHDLSITKRVLFNRPFDLIDVEFKSAAEVIPSLSRDIQHILWLDYDDYLRDWMIQDVSSALTQLSPGSLFFVTIDVEPPVRPGNPGEWEHYFREQAGNLIPHDWTTASFGRDKLADVVRKLLDTAIKSSLAYRVDVEFAPLFSVLYADGHLMYTVGGMVAGKTQLSHLRRAFGDDRPEYIRTSLDTEPYRIRVPNLTRKERAYLDAHIPTTQGWTPDAFELSAGEVEEYEKIYRFYPNYIEAF